MKQRQIDWVAKQLETKGYVSRNKALSKYITRLGAHICKINNTIYKDHWVDVIGGYEIKTVKGRKVKDYVYRVV